MAHLHVHTATGPIELLSVEDVKALARYCAVFQDEYSGAAPQSEIVKAERLEAMFKRFAKELE